LRTNFLCTVSLFEKAIPKNTQPVKSINQEQIKVSANDLWQPLFKRCEWERGSNLLELVIPIDVDDEPNIDGEDGEHDAQKGDHSKLVDELDPNGDDTSNDDEKDGSIDSVVVVHIFRNGSRAKDAQPRRHVLLEK